MNARRASTARLLAVLVFAASAARAAEYVWIEAEDTAAINFKPGVSGWGHPEYLSGGKWLHVAVDAAKVDAEVPAEGLQLRYAVKIDAAATHQIWARVGHEFVRAPFDWRIDDGEWKTVPSTALTTDLMELDVWCEVAWLQLGEQALSAGTHSLEIRIPRAKDEKGQTARILFELDALCLSAAPFHPNGPHKPDADPRTDRDRQAAAHVFRLPEPASPEARAAVALDGLWEVCRNDEPTPPADVAVPMKDFPARAFWSAIDVPGDRNKLRPDLIFAHRLWYRTRVDVPASQVGRSFFLRFPQNNLNTTVFVNGAYCGFFKHPFAGFQIDVTPAVKAGVNEVWVGIRDAWYGYATNPNDPMKLRRRFNLPIRYFGEGFQDLAYPIWNHPQSGLLQTPEFVVAGGPVYAEDVFAKPSVSRRTLAVEIALRNPSAKPARGEVRWQAVNAKTGEAERTFDPVPFELAAGATQTLEASGAWENPKLWWPDEPNLYVLRTTVAVDGRVADTHDTRFGFREWDWSTRDFKLNGIPWHGWADCHTHPTKERWLEFYRKTGQTVMRFWGTTWQGLAPEAALNFFDENGVVCRRSGTFDGETIGYNAIENDPDLKKESPIKMDLLRNWREQMAAQVRAERNHPSVMIWSLENEFLYINCNNLYGGLMDLFEAEVTKTSQEVLKVDPTRPNMVDGGGATKAQTMPVHGDHYIAGEPQRYPDLAYEANPTGGGRGRWEWDQTRPRFLGEDYFMTGNHPEVAYFQGDGAFAGKPVRGVAIWNRILQEGYRWAGYGAWQFWHGQADTDQSQYVAYAARAVFSRDWNWTFAAGKTVNRLFALYNDTRYADPITFAWTLTVGGRKAGGASKEYRVAPGTSVRFEEPLAMPRVKGRAEGELVLTLAVKGQEVFRDVKAVAVIEPETRDMAGLGAADLVVYDPQGAASAFLKERRIPFTPVTALSQLPAEGKVLLVGRDALDEAESASSRLAAYAAGGRRVVVLEQAHPLRYQGLPAEMEAAENRGFTAFGEDAEHPALRGLKDPDFFTWGAGRPVYRGAYEKPVRGARSLVQCDDRLRFTALVEVPVGPGLMLLSQLSVAEQLDANPVARQLLLNLLGHAATYRIEFRPVTAAVADLPHVKAALDAMGVTYEAAPGPIEAISKQKPPATAVIAATPANLKTLAANLAAVQAFTAGGGAIVLCGLTPEGLADYNRIVGVDHMIRPGARERVTLPPVRDRLTAGLTAGDVVLYSSKRIFAWTAGNYVVSDLFSYVVDYDEVASFASSDFSSYGNIVNGFVGADGWPLIIDFPIPTNGRPFAIRIALPREQTLTELTYDPSVNYNPTTKIALSFDGQDRREFAIEPVGDAQVVAIDPPRPAREFTLELCEWQIDPARPRNAGIDNIALKAQRPPEFYRDVKPMLNVGGLMHYLKGEGHIVLCNVLFQEREEVPENATKKRAILAAILRNLKAPFAEGRTVVAGMNLKYEPVDLSGHGTQYRDDKGWFGDKAFTFRDLPTGEQRFAGVKYSIYEMATSPVPTVVMPAGRGVPGKMPDEIRGIPVGRKADALFFLQAARIDRRRNPNDVKKGTTFELARYVVNYEDGGKEEIPILAEIDVGDYKQPAPAVVPGAQLAWVRPYEGTEFSAVAYSKQWRNPRPDATIKSIDVRPGADKAGTIAVLAVTTAQGE